MKNRKSVPAKLSNEKRNSTSTIPLVEITVHNKPFSGKRSCRTSVKESSESQEKIKSKDKSEKNQSAANTNELLHEELLVKHLSEGIDVKNTVEVGVDTTDEESEQDQQQHFEVLKDECRKMKFEAAQYRSKNDELAKELQVGEEAVDFLKSQIVDLEEYIYRLTQTNSELLGVVLGNLSILDVISKLEKEGDELADNLMYQKSYSSYLNQKLLAADGEIASLKTQSLKYVNEPNTLQQLTEYRRSTPKSCLDIIPAQSGLYKSEASLCLKSGGAPLLTVHLSTPLASVPSFYASTTHDLEYHPVTLEVDETVSCGNGVLLMKEHNLFSSLEDDPEKQKLSNYEKYIYELENINPLNNPETDSIITISSLSETKFLRGLEKSIEITNYETDIF